MHARWLLVILVGATACGGGGGEQPTGPEASAISLSPTQLVLRVGYNTTLAVDVRDVSGAAVASPNVAWRSSDPAIVTVDPRGVMVGQRAGNATVTATSGGKSASAAVIVGDTTYDVVRLGTPKFITADYIDLAKIGRVSKFRSAIGHDYSDSTESCRSMKHYYEPKTTLDWSSVEVFSPVEGTVWSVSRGGSGPGSSGGQVAIIPKDAPAFTIIIFHPVPIAALTNGQWIRAGDRIGTHVGSITYSDIAVRVETLDVEGYRLVSYFDAMTDAVFARYQSRGLATRQAATITKEQRDADPVACVGESQFPQPGRLENWIVLN